MGHVEEGRWVRADGFPSDRGGAYARPASKFRCTLGPQDVAAGRYHLYASYACPWAHRTLIARALGGLESAISLSIVNPFMGEDGWTFAPADGVIVDPIHGAEFLWQVYVAAQSDYTGRVTVPILWDRERNSIVCNEAMAMDLPCIFTDVGLARDAKRGQVELDVALLDAKRCFESTAYLVEQVGQQLATLGRVRRSPRRFMLEHATPAAARERWRAVIEDLASLRGAPIDLGVAPRTAAVVGGGGA